MKEKVLVPVGIIGIVVAPLDFLVSILEGNS
jgi:hypothetical protein